MCPTRFGSADTDRQASRPQPDRPAPSEQPLGLLQLPPPSPFGATLTEPSFRRTGPEVLTCTPRCKRHPARIHRCRPQPCANYSRPRGVPGTGGAALPSRHRFAPARGTNITRVTTITDNGHNSHNNSGATTGCDHLGLTSLVRATRPRGTPRGAGRGSVYATRLRARTPAITPRATTDATSDRVAGHARQLRTRAGRVTMVVDNGELASVVDEVTRQ